MMQNSVNKLEKFVIKSFIKDICDGKKITKWCINDKIIDGKYNSIIILQSNNGWNWVKRR